MMKTNYLYFTICCCLCSLFLSTVKAQPLNDQCFQAVLIDGITACSEMFNEGTEFTGPQNSCTQDSVGSLWFKYYMSGSSKLKISTQADFYKDGTNFNDVITIFRNSCSNLMPLNCYNEDRFGFVGEEIYTDQLNSSDTVWIRVSGSQDLFGKCSGKICLSVEPVGQNEGNPPMENTCQTAEPIGVNQPCVVGSNIHATVDWAIPSNFQNSSHCVWYSFAPTESIAYTVNTKADFSDVITLWTGNCTPNGTFEVASTDAGQTLITPVLNAGQNYFVQVCGAFSSVEGDFCLEVKNTRPVQVDVSMYMEGPWDVSTSKMTTLLWQFDILPSGQPYNTSPWNYSGLEGAGWTNSDYPSNSVDWVLVSLRSTTLASDVLDQTAGVLLEDGTVQLFRDLEVDSRVSEAYIVVEHRNHLPAMSPTKVAIANDFIAFDFTQSNSYATGAAGQKQINGDWMLYAGNVDQSNATGYEITGSDRIIWGTETGLFNVYKGSDFNLDRDVNGADRIYWQDNNGFFSNIPK